MKAEAAFEAGTNDLFIFPTRGVTWCNARHVIERRYGTIVNACGKKEEAEWTRCEPGMRTGKERKNIYIFEIYFRALTDYFILSCS